MIDIPRRASADGAHGEKWTEDLAQRMRVLVAGDMPRDIVAFDVDAGWVDVWTHDDMGRRLLHDGKPMTYRIFGPVSVTVRDGD